MSSHPLAHLTERYVSAAERLGALMPPAAKAAATKACAKIYGVPNMSGWCPLTLMDQVCMQAGEAHRHMIAGCCCHVEMLLEMLSATCQIILFPFERSQIQRGP